MSLHTFAVYFFNRCTAGISRDFAGKYLSLTQLINVSLPSILPPITFSFISIPVDKSLQIVSQYNLLPFLLSPPHDFPFIPFSFFPERNEAERIFFSFGFSVLEVCYFLKEGLSRTSRE